MPDDRNDGDRERTDPGVVSDRILTQVLDLVKDQMSEQAGTMKRFMVLMLVMLVLNAALSGVNLAVQTFGVEVSTTGNSTTVEMSSDGQTATVVTGDMPPGPLAEPEADAPPEVAAPVEPGQ